MRRTTPHFWRNNGVVLFLVLATTASVLGALASSITAAELHAPSVLATRDATTISQAPTATFTAPIAPCNCSGNGRSPAVIRHESGKTLSPEAADKAKRPQPPAFPAEANAYARAIRAEADPRTILARLAELSRRAPRSVASSPEFGNAKHLIRLPPQREPPARARQRLGTVTSSASLPGTNPSDPTRLRDAEKAW